MSAAKAAAPRQRLARSAVRGSDAQRVVAGIVDATAAATMALTPGPQARTRRSVDSALQARHHAPPRAAPAPPRAAPPRAAPRRATHVILHEVVQHELSHLRARAGAVVPDHVEAQHVAIVLQELRALGRHGHLAARPRLHVELHVCGWRARRTTGGRR